MSPRNRTAGLLCLLALSALPTLAADNVGVIEIPDPRPYTQVAAISDVHGEYARLRKLLAAAGLTREDGTWAGGKTLMVVVGDSLDKGPESLPVLEFWQDLMSGAAKRGGRVVVLLGNHEAEYLANPAGDSKSETVYTELKQRGLPENALADPAQTIDHHALGAFLHDLPLAARVGGWLFCHAGWIAKPVLAANYRGPDANWKAFGDQTRRLLNRRNYGDRFFVGPDSILEKKSGASGKKWWKSPDDVRDLEYRLDSYGLRGVVLGHQPGAFGLDEQVGAFHANRETNRFFKTDSGMAPVVAGERDSGGTKSARDGYPGHLLLFTHPSELMSPLGPDPAHVLSVGFDRTPGGGYVFTRKAGVASEN